MDGDTSLNIGSIGDAVKFLILILIGQHYEKPKEKACSIVFIINIVSLRI